MSYYSEYLDKYNAPVKYLPLKWDGYVVPDYTVGSNGDIFRYGKKLVTWQMNGRNYSTIYIEGHKNAYRHDYMVAYTFLNKPEDAIRLIHVNGDITDDREINLVWYRKIDVKKEYQKYAIIEDDGTIKEEWKPCKTEYNPDLGYEVSNMGMIRDKEKKLVDLHDSHGYSVFYYIDKFYAKQTRIKAVHQAVAEAFIPNPNNYPMVNHLDGNKHNNFIFNLEWVNNGMNAEHAYLQKLNKSIGYTPQQIVAVCKLLVDKIPHVEIEYMTGVDRKTISDIYRGRRWKDISSKFTMPAKKWTPEIKQKIEQMIISGMKGKEIYAKLDIPYDQSAISLYERMRRELKAVGKI